MADIYLHHRPLFPKLLCVKAGFGIDIGMAILVHYVCIYAITEACLFKLLFVGCLFRRAELALIKMNDPLFDILFE